MSRLQEFLSRLDETHSYRRMSDTAYKGLRERIAAPPRHHLSLRSVAGERFFIVLFPVTTGRQQNADVSGRRDAYLMWNVGEPGKEVVFRSIETLHLDPVREGVNIIGWEPDDALADKIAALVGLILGKPVTEIDQHAKEPEPIRDRLSMLEFP